MVEHGNIDEINEKSPNGKGWFVGSFLENNSILNTESIGVKWIRHPKGLKKKSGSELGENDRTLVILLSGKWRQFYPGSLQEIILSHPGDFLAFSGQVHECEALEASHLIVIRWKEI